MRSEAMKSKMLYDRPLPVQRIVNSIADSKLLNQPNYECVSVC